MGVTKQDLDDTVKAVKAAEDENKKIQTDYKKASSDLSGALQDKNEAMIKLYRPRLEAVEKRIADCIGDVEHAISRVQVLQQDEEFVEKRFEVVEKLLAGVSKTRTLLASQLLECKKLDKQANDALDGLQGDQEDAVSAFARLEDAANDLEAQLARIRPLAKKHEDAAKAAIAASDQKALTAARVALLDFQFGNLNLTASANLAKVEAFKKSYPTTLKTEADWLRDKLQSLRDDFQGFDEATLKLVRLGQISAAGEPLPEPESAAVDLAKAAKLLGITTKDQPKLNKVLSGKPTAYAKGLGILAEELELEEQDGKKLLAKLEKAGVFG